MLKSAGAGEAPNYRPAENSNASCGMCFYFGKYENNSGYCNQYKFSARESYTCDGFVPSAQKAASVANTAPFLKGRYS